MAKRHIMARCLAATAAVWAFAGPYAPARAEQKLIEGFEDPAAVRVSDGQISAGPRISQGNRAAILTPGTTVYLTLNRLEFGRFPWLRIDTLTVQPLMHSLRVRLSGEKLWLSRIGCVQPGKDTLVLPLPWPPAHKEHDDERVNPQVTLALTNVGGSNLIVDNVRLESAAKPKGCLLVDFGPGGQGVWPGFEPASRENRYVDWEGYCRAIGPLFPNPLTGDFIGRPPTTLAVSEVNLTLPTRLKTAVWLWVTHYGAYNTPSMEYSVKHEGRYLLRRRLTSRQMFGSRGLLQGKEGPWTPKWLDREYAEQFVDLVELALPAGRATLEMRNCQLAALAAAPAPRRGAMAAFLKRLRQDITRYNSQFVLAVRDEATCPQGSLDADPKASATVFQPPANDWCSATWLPVPEDRVEAAKAVVAGGGLAVIRLAVVPHRKTLFLSAAPVFLKSKTGRPLAVGAKAVETWFVQRVPRVLDARFVRQPWVLLPRHGTLGRREICHVAVVVRPPFTARAGTYSGQLLLTVTGGRRAVPIEVEIVDVGPRSEAAPTFGALAPGTADHLYGGMVLSLSKAKLRTLNAKLRAYLLSHGLNALAIASPGLDRRLALKPQYMIDDLETYPIKRATGQTILHLGSALWRLSDAEIEPGSRTHRKAVTRIVASAESLAAKARLRRHYFHVGRIWTPDALVGRGRVATAVAAGGGRAALCAPPHVLAHLDGDKLKELLGPVQALILDPGHPSLPEVAKRFKALAGPRQVYTCPYQTDRYQIGFHAAALELDGFYLHRLFMYGGAYAGFWLQGVGLLVPQAGGGFAPTLGMLRLWQGRNDYLLVRRAQELLVRAKAAGVGAGELEKARSEIVNRIRKDPSVQYDVQRLRSGPIDPRTLETWRVNLVRAAGEVASRLDEAEDRK